MPNSVKVACIMMQKDEELLLEPWILHHGYLFGFENLYVYDNGSTSTATHEILNRYACQGMSVVWDRTTNNDYTLKGWIVGDRIKDLQRSREYDFYLPMDCDEFLAHAGVGGVSMSRKRLHDYLSLQIGQNKILRIHDCLANVPGHCDMFVVQGHRKSVVPAEGLTYLDHGHHEPELATGTDMVSSELIHVHMHNKPLSYLLRSARDKLQPFVDVDDPEAIRNFNGVGNHLKKYLAYSTEEYYRSVDSYPRARFNGFNEFLRAFRMFDFPHMWTSGAPNHSENEPPNVMPGFIDDKSIAHSIQSEDHPPAIAACLRWHQLRTTEVEKLREVFLDAIGQRDWDQAIGTLAEYRLREPNSPEGFAWSVRALREGGSLVEAEEIGKAGLQRFPWHEQLFLEWALICFSLRKWDEAQTRFDEFRARFPMSREGYIRSIEIAKEFDDVEKVDELTAKLASILNEN